MQFYTFISDNLLSKHPCAKQLDHDRKWMRQRSWFLSHVYNANCPFLVPPNLEKTSRHFLLGSLYQHFLTSLSLPAGPRKTLQKFPFWLTVHLRTQICSPWSEHEKIPQVEHLVKIFLSLNDSVHVCHLQYILI